MNEIKKVSGEIEYSGFKLLKNGLEAIGSPSFEQWQECWSFVGKADGAVRFWRGDLIRYGENAYGEMYTQFINDTGKDYITLAKDVQVSRRFENGRRRPNLSFAHHQEVAFDLESKEQETLLDIAEKDNLNRNDFRKVVKQYKKSKLPRPVIPDGVYSVLYADPPWDIGSMVLDKWESPLDDKYPTMTPEELIAMKLPQMAEDSVCFMWTTLSTLPQALNLLEVWGFKYHITITWDKGGGWSANGFHRRTELLLFGYRGILSNVIKQEGEYIPTIITEPKTTHSTKPKIIYDYIDNRTIGNKIELFARIKREGWASWGNQL